MDKAIFIGIGIVFILSGFGLLLKPGGKNQDTKGQGVVIPAFAMLMILGLVSMGYPFSPFFKSSTPDAGNGPGVAGASQKPPASATSTPAATAAAVPIAITSPTDGAGVDRKFTVYGTAPDLGGDKLWLFVWGDNATVPGKVYYRTSYAPIDVVNGFWSINLGQLGSPGKDIGHTFILRLARANSLCSDKISHIVPSSTGNFFIRELPSGCTEAAPPLGVKKES